MSGRSDWRLLHRTRSAPMLEVIAGRDPTCAWATIEIAMSCCGLIEIAFFVRLVEVFSCHTADGGLPVLLSLGTVLCIPLLFELLLFIASWDICPQRCAIQ